MALGIGINGSAARASGTGALSTGALGTSVTGSSFIVFSGTQSQTPNTPTDTYTNTWTLLFSITDTDNTVHQECWTALNGNGGANHAFQTTGFTGGNRAYIIAIEVTSGGAVLALDGSPGFKDTFYSGSATYSSSVTSVSGGIAIAAGLAGPAGPDTITIAGSYTSLAATVQSAANVLCCAAGWRTTAASTAYDPAFTDTAGGGFVSANILLSAAANTGIVPGAGSIAVPDSANPAPTVTPGNVTLITPFVARRRESGLIVCERNTKIFLPPRKAA